jgi:ribosomal protein L28
LIAVTAAEEDGSHHDHGGEEAVATRVGEALDISSVDSSNEEDNEEVISVHSVHSAELYGDGVCDSPNFDEHNDPMNDSPMDNKVSKYSFYSCLTHYMEGHKISESNCAAVELCLLSEAGALSISPSLMKLRMTSSRTQRILSVRICAECIRVLRKKFSEESVAEIRS